jgi:hypothetical protein
MFSKVMILRFMRLTYAHIKDKPKKLLALTGLTRSEFDDLLAAFDKVNRSKAAAPGQPRPRQRSVAGSQKAALQSNEDRLLFILVCLKIYPLQEIAGELFGMEMPKVSEWMHLLLPLVCDALDEFGVMPERDARAVAPAQGKQSADQTATPGDTDRRGPRSKNPKKQIKHHGRKKDMYTNKSLIMAGRAF